MREQRAAMEKELGSMQAKAQGSYQELQTMQIKVKALILAEVKTLISVFAYNSVINTVQKVWNLKNVKGPIPFGSFVKATCRPNRVV